MIIDAAVVWASTANGDRILFGAAIDSEDASQPPPRPAAALTKDALRPLPRVYDLFPTSPLAGEGLYRAATSSGGRKVDVMTVPPHANEMPHSAKAWTNNP